MNKAYRVSKLHTQNKEYYRNILQDHLNLWLLPVAFGYQQWNLQQLNGAFPLALGKHLFNHSPGSIHEVTMNYWAVLF